MSPSSLTADASFSDPLPGAPVSLCVVIVLLSFTQEVRNDFFLGKVDRYAEVFGGGHQKLPDGIFQLCSFLSRQNKKAAQGRLL